MSHVQRYAVPTPITRTPSNHAWPVNCGSCPIVMWKTYPAATEMANCAASIRLTGDFMPGAYHG